MAEELEANLASKVEENNNLAITGKKHNAVIDAYTRYKEMVEGAYATQATELGVLEATLQDLAKGEDALSEAARKLVEIRRALKVAMLASVPDVSKDDAAE